jgi:hypothetical protein
MQNALSLKEVADESNESDAARRDDQNHEPHLIRLISGVGELTIGAQRLYRLEILQGSFSLLQLIHRHLSRWRKLDIAFAMGDPMVGLAGLHVDLAIDADSAGPGVGDVAEDVLVAGLFGNL